MTSIFDLLEETEESKKTKELLTEVSILSSSRMPRHFSAIQINDELALSIQASAMHYSNPRETLADLTEYTKVELALIHNGQEFTYVSDVLPSFSRLEEIEKHRDDVYAYVPVDLVEQLYAELIEQQRK